MNDDVTQRIYREAGLGHEVPLGARPALVVVDFSCGFTDPESALGADMSAEVTATKGLLDAARNKGVLIVFTTVAFEPNLEDGGLWMQKAPSLGELQVGSRWVEIDPRLGRRSDEIVLVKRAPSALFGTALLPILISRHIDSVILCGATTSGCVRATAVDLLQYGFPAVVPRECVGDRARAPHEASLCDMQAKYANVSGIAEVLSYVQRLSGAEGEDARD